MSSFLATNHRAIDGDTFVLDSGKKVRLIGVDTPETKHPQKPVQPFGKEATQFTRLVRLLAYAYLHDGTFLNTEIIKQGYGFAYARYPFKYLDEFRNCERKARQNGRGLWSIDMPSKDW